MEKGFECVDCKYKDLVGKISDLRRCVISVVPTTLATIRSASVSFIVHILIFTLM